MGEFNMHRCRFFDYTPSAVQCLAYGKATQKCAVSRADGSVELWSICDNWYQEKVFAPHKGCSVEALVWVGARLFSAGLHCMLHEYDIFSGQHKSSVHSNSGPVWCMAVNEAGSQLAAGTEEGCVAIYNISEEGLEFHKALDKQDGRILCVAWYERDGLLVTGGEDHLRIWSYKSGHAVQRLTLGRKHAQAQTIVWAVAVSSDFTIVSGDSRGKTSFWNGRQGTLIKDFQSHKEAVLSLCLSPDGSTVFSSGVDPNIVQFKFIATSPSSEWKQWVRSMARSQHTHDVRAMTFAEDCVISGGVDCQIVINYLNPEENMKPWRRIPAIPQHSLIQVATKANLTILRYPNFLELWQLGSTTATSEKNGEVLPLKTNAVKLLELRSRGDEPLLCCAVSQCGQYIAYSSESLPLRIFKLNVEGERVCPKVCLTRVQFRSDDFLPSQHLAFSQDGATLFSIATTGSLQMLNIDTRQLKPPLDFPEGMRAAYLLQLSDCGTFIAITDQDSAVHVFNLLQDEIVCTLPRYAKRPTALAFHPTLPMLLVVHSDLKVLEYDLSEQEYTSWSRQVNAACLSEWRRLAAPITSAFYLPHQPHLVLLSSNDTICVIDKKQRMPTEDDQLAQQSRAKKSLSDRSQGPHAFHLCSKFKHLMTAAVLEDGCLVLVERPPLALTESLPAALMKKQFGT